MVKGEKITIVGFLLMFIPFFITIGILIYFGFTDMLQAISTAYLTGITFLYIFLLWKSNKDMKEREEKRREQKKEDLRNLIKAELEDNIVYVKIMQEEIKKIDKTFESDSNYVWTDYISPHDKSYDAVLRELGILNKIEIIVISDIYKLTNELIGAYEKLPRTKELKKFVTYGKYSINLINKLWTILNDFYNDKNYEKFERRYNDYISSLPQDINSLGHQVI